MALILIVDDRHRDRRVVTKMLTNEGYQIICVTNAASALSCIERVKPDLAVLNGLAEGFDSYNVLNKIKEKNNQFPALIYIMRAGDALEKLREAVAFSLMEIRFHRRKKTLFRFDRHHSRNSAKRTHV